MTVKALAAATAGNIASSDMQHKAGKRAVGFILNPYARTGKSWADTRRECLRVWPLLQA
ncbi:hypothetical protein BURKHO8Y_370015 [Burkholderia sp. 8Y]|nr:hypothetical protein BURKHO8Y_370015 [Burkholderia sp. 8Y]